MVGVARPKGLKNVAVVFTALISVSYQQRYRRASGFALVHARQNLNCVRLIALRDVAAGAGAAAVQVGLNVRLAQRHTRRAAVNHAANGRAVGFTKIGDCE